MIFSIWKGENVAAVSYFVEFLHHCNKAKGLRQTDM